MTMAAPDAGPDQTSPETTAAGSERRRELRDRPLTGAVQIDGTSCEIFDWSSSGLSARGYDGKLGQGDRTRVSVRIALRKHLFSFDCDLILIRVDPAAKLIAGVFAAMAREDRVAVASYFESLEAAADRGLRDAITTRR